MITLYGRGTTNKLPDDCDWAFKTAFATSCCLVAGLPDIPPRYSIFID